MANITTLLAPIGATGNNTHPAVAVTGSTAQVAVQFVVEAAGGTPTVTWKVQGSMDGTNWYDVFYDTDASDTGAAATRTATAVGAQLEFVDLAASRFYNWYRAVTTSNTNITYRVELWYQQR